MGLIHGSAPKQLVLCHLPTRPQVRGYDVTIPPLSEAVRYHEAVCQPLFPTRVACIALNTYSLPEDEARAVIAQTEDETGLPADDCVRFGPDRLLDALGASRAG